MINRRGWTVAALGATIAAFLMAGAAYADTSEPNRVDVEYAPPKIIGS